MRPLSEAARHRTSALLFVALTTLSSAAPQTFADDVVEEPTPAEREELDRMALELDGAEKVTGPIICQDAYVRGKFGDLVNYFYERKDGYAAWRLTGDGDACVNASSIGCVDTHIMLLKGASEESLDMNATFDRWLSTAALAKVLDQDVQIEFSKNSGSWQVCRVNRFTVFE